MHTHTQKANKRQLWNSAITEYSRLSASKAKRTRPALIAVDNCTPTTQGKSTKGGGHTPTNRPGGCKNRTGVVKNGFSLLLSHHMWAYTPPPYTHVVLTTVRKKGRG